jgi:hypothetical protein
MSATATPQARPSGGQLAAPADAVAARVSANRVRAEYLQSVVHGLLTVHDVLRAAAEPAGRPLLRISLVQLLAAQPGWGDVRVGGTVERLVRATSRTATPVRPDRLDVAWLLDPRADGTRLVAFLDLTVDRPALPGFPYVPVMKAGS